MALDFTSDNQGNNGSQKSFRYNSPSKLTKFNKDEIPQSESRKQKLNEPLLN